MKVNEIFSSIDGEGIRTGYLVTFIRTFGCSLRCSYCDTMYSCEQQENETAYKEMTIPEIIKQCEFLKNKRITFTGGEPLIQKGAYELVETLIKSDYEVNIETNGAHLIKDYVQMRNVDASKLIITMDWKSPYSQMEKKMLTNNLRFLRANDVLKFVVANREDLDAMKRVLEGNKLFCNVFVSPVFGQIEGQEIIQYLKENDLQNVRVQVQLHKIFWDPQKRGV